MRNGWILLALLVTVSLGAARCSPPAAGAADGDGPEAQETTDADSPQELPPDDGTPPVMAGLTLYQNPDNGLAAIATFTTDEDARPGFVIYGPNGLVYRRHRFPGLARTHEIPIVGMRADTAYRIEVTAEDQWGNIATAPAVDFVTDPLPADFPPLVVTRSDPGRRCPGVTLFNVQVLPEVGFGLVMALDETGEVVWYHREGAIITDVQKLKNGNIIIIFALHGLVEVDIMGREVNRWPAIRADLDSVHHSVEELPNGNLLFLSSEMRSLEGFPAPDGGETWNVVGDVVVEMDRYGSVVKKLSLFDLFDPYVYDDDCGFEGFWDTAYYVTGGTFDWTHANAAVWRQDTGQVLVSVRHLDLMAAIDWQSLTVDWVFGAGRDFCLDQGRWPCHQHAPSFLPDGRLLVYDNGNHRTDGPEATRVAVYHLNDSDSGNLRATQEWEYDGGEPYFASIVGDADELSCGNLLITDGGLHDGDGVTFSRLREVTFPGEPQVLFEMVLHDNDGVQPRNISLYRSVHLDSLYWGLQADPEP